MESDVHNEGSSLWTQVIPMTFWCNDSFGTNYSFVVLMIKTVLIFCFFLCIILWQGDFSKIIVLQ